MLMGDVSCRITVGYDKYWIVGFASKAAFRIVDVNGDVVAEVSFLFICQYISLLICCGKMNFMI